MCAQQLYKQYLVGAQQDPTLFIRDHHVGSASHYFDVHAAHNVAIQAVRKIEACNTLPRLGQAGSREDEPTQMGVQLRAKRENCGAGDVRGCGAVGDTRAYGVPGDAEPCTLLDAPQVQQQRRLIRLDDLDARG